MINPYINILTVTTQQINPNENITREEAVSAYTKGSAYAEFKDDQKGMLAKDMLADIVVLSQNIFKVPEDQLIRTKSVMTIIDGKIVYQNMNLK